MYDEYGNWFEYHGETPKQMPPKQLGDLIFPHSLDKSMKLRDYIKKLREE